MDKYYKNDMPETTAQDDARRAAYVLHWVMAGEARGSRGEGFSDAEVIDALGTIALWYEETHACSGEYAGVEDEFVIEAAEWQAEQSRKLRELERELYQIQHQIAGIKRQRRHT